MMMIFYYRSSYLYGWIFGSILQLKRSFMKMFVFALRWLDVSLWEFLITFNGNPKKILQYWTVNSVHKELNRMGFFQYIFKFTITTFAKQTMQNLDKWIDLQSLLQTNYRLYLLRISDDDAKQNNDTNGYKQMALINFKYLSYRRARKFVWSWLIG